MFIVLFWAKNIVSITIHKPLSPMNLLFNFLIRITGKNDRQTSAIKTKMLLTYQDLYLTYKFTICISITTI